MSSHPPKHVFYANVLHEHQLLRELLETISRLVSSRPESSTPLAKLLKDLADLLEHHFAHEEQGGYFSDALQCAPHLSDQAAELQLQHADFSAVCLDLAEEATADNPSTAARQQFQAKCEKFVANLNQHESDENRLIQEAYQRDEPAGD